MHCFWNARAWMSSLHQQSTPCHRHRSPNTTTDWKVDNQTPDIQLYHGQRREDCGRSIKDGVTGNLTRSLQTVMAEIHPLIYLFVSVTCRPPLHCCYYLKSPARCWPADNANKYLCLVLTKVLRAFKILAILLPGNRKVIGD